MNKKIQYVRAALARGDRAGASRLANVLGLPAQVRQALGLPPALTSAEVARRAAVLKIAA